MFSIHDPQGVKLLSRFSFNFSHLNENKFRRNFKECVGPICSCRLEIESTQHFFLRRHFYHVERSELLKSPYDIDLAINKQLKILLLMSLNHWAQISIITWQIEKYFLVVLLIYYLSRFFGFVLCVYMYIYTIPIYIYMCIIYIYIYIYMGSFKKYVTARGWGGIGLFCDKSLQKFWWVGRSHLYSGT